MRNSDRSTVPPSRSCGRCSGRSSRSPPEGRAARESCRAEGASAAVVVLAVALIAAGSASATERPSAAKLYDTTRFLPHTNNECGGAAGCQVVRSGWHVVKAGKVLRLSLDCPEGKRHLRGWDTQQHEH